MCCSSAAGSICTAGDAASGDSAWLGEGWIDVHALGANASRNQRQRKARMRIDGDIAATFTEMAPVRGALHAELFAIPVSFYPGRLSTFRHSSCLFWNAGLADLRPDAAVENGCGLADLGQAQPPSHRLRKRSRTSRPSSPTFASHSAIATRAAVLNLASNAGDISRVIVMPFSRIRS